MGGFTQTDCFRMGALWGVAAALFAVIVTRGSLPAALVIVAAVVAFLAVLYLAYRGCGQAQPRADAAPATPASRTPSPMEKAAVGAPISQPAPIAAPVTSPGPAPAANTVPAKTASAAKPASAKPAPAYPVPNGADATEPRMLSAPRDGGPDDLRQIKGVGPKLEGLLHSLGVFHFDQIASWSPAEVAWVDDRLNFKGRIARDGWVDQARALAAGETTDFAGRVARGEVPTSTA